MSVVLLTGFLAATFVAGCGDDKSPGPDVTPPAAVTDLALLRTTETSATVTWTGPGDDGDKGQAASYDLRYSLSALPAGWDSATVVEELPIPRQAGVPETVTVSGLTRDRIYNLALRTLDDAANESDLSNMVQAQTADPTPPAQVTDLRVTSVEMEAVTLQFTAPGDDGYEGTATAYEVRYGPDAVTEETWEGSIVFAVVQTPHPAGTMETIRVAGLTGEATLHFGLRARDDGGHESPVSNDVVATLPADTVPPSAIRDLVAGGTEPYTLTLTWTASGDNGDEGRAASYAVRYATLAITEATWSAATPVMVTLIPKAAGQHEELTLTDLPGDTTLWFCVRAMDEKGNQGAVSKATKWYVRRTPKTWTIRVDGSGDAPTVQAGIDSSRTGDTVLVHPGRYYENLDYRGKDLVLRSAEGPKATILDGSLRDSSVVVIRRGETRAAVLEGFTITGGRGSTIWGKAQDGGGICCEESSPTIRGNKIVGNSCGSRGDGGGICAGARYVDPPSGALIEGNIIENNESGHNGGGLACFNGNYEIRGNVFRGNQCWADGGGAWVWMVQGQAALEGNEFWDNVAGDHGGGIYSAGGSGAGQYSIEGNLFVRNRTVGTGFFGDTGSGGAIAALLMKGVIRYNTLVWNDGQHLTHDGGGGLLLYLTGVDLAVYGNLIAYNEECGISCWWEGTTATMGPNLLWGNGGGDLGIGSGQCPSGWADVLLFADPLFCDPANENYQVASNSPALTDSMTFGCYPDPGCPARTSPTTWDRIRWSKR